MPVSTAMNGGIAWCGLTRVWNSPSTSPPRTLTAPTSVIIEPAAAEPPVVSRSTTQNVTSRRLRPSSSKLRCDSQRAVRAAGRRRVSAHGADARCGHRQFRGRHAAYPGSSTPRPASPQRRRPRHGRHPARREHPLALRGLRQPDPVRRHPHPPYDGVLALRPRRGAPRSRIDHATRRTSPRSPAAGADAPTPIELVSRAEADAADAVTEAERTGPDARRAAAAAAARPGPGPGGGPGRRRAGPAAADHVPASLARVAAFAPARRARLAGSQIASVLEADDGVPRPGRRARARPGARPRRRGRPGVAPAAADPVDLAAVAYLLRPDGLGRTRGRRRASRCAGDAGAGDAGRPRSWTGSAPARDARPRASRRPAPGTASRSPSSRRRTPTLRHKLGDARTPRPRGRGGRRGRRDGGRRRCGPAPRRAATARRRGAPAARPRGGARARPGRRPPDASAPSGATATLRARLLLDTLLETAQGLRRELALPAVEGSPADAVEAHVAEQGSRARSGHGLARPPTTRRCSSSCSRCRGRT